MKPLLRVPALMICLILVVISFSSCGFSYRFQAAELVLSNREALQGLAQKILEKGRETGEEFKTFHFQVNETDYQITYLNLPASNGDRYYNEHVKFRMASVGLVPSSAYYNFYYSPSDAPFGEGINPRLSDSSDSASQTKYGYGWVWSEPGSDNYGYTERICESWFYSEAHF